MVATYLSTYLCLHKNQFFFHYLKCEEVSGSRMREPVEKYPDLGSGSVINNFGMEHCPWRAEYESVKILKFNSYPSPYKIIRIVYSVLRITSSCCLRTLKDPVKHSFQFESLNVSNLKELKLTGRVSDLHPLYTDPEPGFWKWMRIWIRIRGRIRLRILI